MKFGEKSLKTKMKPSTTRKGTENAAKSRETIREELLAQMEGTSGEQVTSIEYDEFPCLPDIDVESTSEGWQSVPSPRRSNRPVTATNNSSSQPISTSNKFATLANHHSDQNHNLSSNSSKQTIVTPIYLISDEKYSVIINEIKNNITGDFETKQCNGKIKISLSTIDDYRVLTKFYDNINKKYYTFVNPDERNFSVVIRGVPYGLTDNEIYDALSQTYPILKVCRLHNRERKPTPLVAIELVNNKDGQSILSLRSLCHSIVTVEPRRRSKTVTQCGRCQRLGHTKNYCRLDPRCGRCAGPHLTPDCKSAADSKLCANCGNQHHARYRGCAAFSPYKKSARPSLKPISNPPQPPLPQSPSHTSAAQPPPIIGDSQPRGRPSGPKPAEPQARDAPPESSSRPQRPWTRSSATHSSSQSLPLNFNLMDFVSSFIKQFIPQIKSFISDLIAQMFTDIYEQP